MMKHDTITKPLPIATTKEVGKKCLWKSKGSSETSTPKSPITKAFDFLPWSRSKKSSNDKSNRIKNDSASASATGGGVIAINTNSSDDKKDALNYQRNIFRNGGDIIRDILNEKVNKTDDRVCGRFQVPRARQVTGRNKSLDINELINCVERELGNDNSINGRHADVRKSHRFLDDTFIENIMRAKETYQRNLQLENDEDDDEADYYHQNDHQPIVDCNDTEDEYFYQQQQELAQLCKHTDPLKQANTNGSAQGNISPKHILFNDENTVYLIKKELPVNKSMEANIKAQKNCDKQRKHSESILNARLKFKKLPSSNSTLNDTKSVVLNNNRTMANSNRPLSPTRRSILQRQNTTPEQYSCLHSNSSPDILRKRSPSAGRYQTSSCYSPTYQRRKSLTDGVNCDHVASSLHENGNSSTSSMDSGGSNSGGILNDRPKSDKPRKKLSFREPVVAGKRSSRRQSAETASATTNGFNGPRSNNSNDSNCDNNRISRRTTPTNDSISNEEDPKQVGNNKKIKTDNLFLYVRVLHFHLKLFFP